MSEYNPLPVTLPFPTPRQEVFDLLNGIWDRNWLTNSGPVHQEFESKLGAALGLEYVKLVSNGTVALQLAYQALGLEGEVITTPISYVATTSSLAWEGCTPVFVDVLSTTMCIDPQAIEAAITSRTTAIVATHCYGLPCDVEAIESIAKKHGIKVVYDAAHAVGSTYHGRSLLSYGDLSTTSLHATKLLHAVEGGAVVSASAALDRKIFLNRNFGHDGPERFEGVGINGKMSEFHAAVGLVNIRHLDEILAKRKAAHALYDAALAGARVSKLEVPEGAVWNCSYYPVLFESEAALLRTLEALSARSITARRYFYPSLDSLDYARSANLPVAHDVTRRVACLPLMYQLTKEDVARVAEVIHQEA
ncbi:DegT/DnrJ/EryC1/StrS family aminotransferase [Flavobacteriales bacterium]|nr:DegT/DnrJ/EryC1/StrS family aminotransferase [Flavobacteriales bacterium]